MRKIIVKCLLHDFWMYAGLRTQMCIQNMCLHNPICNSSRPHLDLLSFYSGDLQMCVEIWDLCTSVATQPAYHQLGLAPSDFESHYWVTGSCAHLCSSYLSQWRLPGVQQGRPRWRFHIDAFTISVGVAAFQHHSVKASVTPVPWLFCCSILNHCCCYLLGSLALF